MKAVVFNLKIPVFEGKNKQQYIYLYSQGCFGHSRRFLSFGKETWLCKGFVEILGLFFSCCEMTCLFKTHSEHFYGFGEF